MRRRKLEHHPNGYLYAHIRGRRVNLGKNERFAYAKLREMERELATCRIKSIVRVDANGRRDIHLDELAHLHLEWVRQNRSPATYDTRKRHIKQFREFVGSRRVSEITKDDIERFYQMAREKHGKSANRGNHAVREIKTLLTWGVNEEKCELAFRRWPAVIERPAETKRFSNEEMGKLLQKAPDDLRDMILFNALTGLRPRELRELTFQQVHIDGTSCPHISIEQHKTASSAKTFMPRSVALCPNAVEIVQRQMQLHPKSKFVFVNPDGRPYKRNVFRQRLNRWCARAGIPERPPYALRHFFGTTQASGGTNLAIIAQLMGHSQIQTTTRYIANVAVVHQQAAALMQQHLAGLIAPPNIPATQPDSASSPPEPST
ncbi:MAG: site-specific integrase [Kiritimatiellaeota bacterium]|nr:site-specific integrase [Kiritimatiellota bacterium]